VDTDNTTPLGEPVDFAIWNPETELYDVDATYQQLVGDFYAEDAPRATLTVDEMKDDWIIGGGGDYVREPGYVQGPVEDLANTNINFSVTAANTASWTTCTSNGVDPAECTFTLRLTALDETFLPKKKKSSSGCSVGSADAPFDPMLPGMLLLALAGVAMRRKRVS
jgi:MYXO-CTERM domain-containing protein